MPQGLSLSDFKAVFFDVDGTLVDTLPALIKGLGDSYEHFNGVRPSDEEIVATIGTPLRVQMRMFTTQIISDEQLEERMNYTVHRYEAHKDLESEFTPAVDALKLVLQCGFKTALITSKNALEVSLVRQRFGWFENVDTIVCSSDVTHPKPDPESAYLACQRLQIQPQEAVFIGDSVYDLRCAQAAGMPSVGVSYGSGTRDALLKENPAHLFDTPEQLLGWARETIDRIPCLERS